MGQRTKKKGDARKKWFLNSIRRIEKVSSEQLCTELLINNGLEIHLENRSNHGFSFFAVHPDDTKSYITDNPYYYKINFPKRDCGNIDKTFLRELKKTRIDTSKVFWKKWM